MAAYKRNSDRIIGKIIIRASLKNESPLLIGKGAGESTDIEIMQLPDGRPYIPASSMAGCLKQFMIDHDMTSDHNYLWGRTGNEEKNPIQSHLRIDDLVPASASISDISMRDGVKINHKTGTAEDAKKYDYHIVEPGLVFSFQSEITIRNGMNINEVTKFVSALRDVLRFSEFRIGALTNTGFGKFECLGFSAHQFKFPENAEAWFQFIDSGNISLSEMKLAEVSTIQQPGSFSIEAIFKLKTSLIIGAYGVKSTEPDKSQLKSRDRHVLPGKSIRGAIRHRAVKILNTLEIPNAESQANSLFGIVDEENGTKAQKGRLRVEEYIFKENEVEPMLQNRIRIDRFTGGVIDGALFNSEPVWTKGQEAIKLTFTILKEALPEEKKLLLLLLKDLWLEDLAIGGEKNIGRGILIGQKAKVFNDGELIAQFQRNGTSHELAFTVGDAAAINSLFEVETSAS